MGHGADMISRIKMNSEIKGRRDFFPSSRSSKGSKTKYQFKEPTEAELKILAEKNRQFLIQQKKKRYIAFFISLAFGLAIMYWIFFSWSWG